MLKKIRGLLVALSVAAAFTLAPSGADACPNCPHKGGKCNCAAKKKEGGCDCAKKGGSCDCAKSAPTKDAKK